MTLSKSEREWNTLARMDPMWAILSDPDKQQNRWVPEEFFTSGKNEIRDLMIAIDDFGFPLRRGAALDFGCGIGRLSQALCDYFEHCEGVDLSASMIALAVQYNLHPPRCTYIQNARPDLAVFPDARFDFVYSAMALQHIEPPYGSNYLREFLRVLAPGGLAIFQVPSETKPTHRSGQAFARIRSKLLLRSRLRRILRRFSLRNRPEDLISMYGIPRRQVCEIVQSAGGQLLQVQPDSSAGENWISYQYWVAKRS